MSGSTSEAFDAGLDNIEEFVSRLELGSDTKSLAVQIYQELIDSERDMFAGRSFELIAGACVVLSSRSNGELCTAEEIAEEGDGKYQEKTVYRVVRSLQKKLDFGMLLANPHVYVDKLQDELDASDDFIESVSDNIDIIIDDGVSAGHKAGAISGAVTYAIVRFHPKHSKYSYTQQEISDIVNTSEVSIRSHYREYSMVLSKHPDSAVEIDEKQIEKHRWSGAK